MACSKINEKMIKVEFSIWKFIGKKYYGKSQGLFEFRCPKCGHIQSVKSVMEHSPHLKNYEIAKWINLACEGTVNKQYGCDASFPILNNGSFEEGIIFISKTDEEFYKSFEFGNEDARKEISTYDLNNAVFFKEVHDNINIYSLKFTNSKEKEIYEINNYQPNEDNIVEVRAELSECCLCKKHKKVWTIYEENILSLCRECLNILYNTIDKTVIRRISVLYEVNDLNDYRYYFE